MTDPLLNEGKNLFQRMKQSADQGLITFCLLLVFILMILIVLALPISQIVIGSLYKNQCPMNYLIPIHLIITGVAMLILLIIIILKVIFFLNITKTLIIYIYIFFCFRLL
jgi:hypothetical protein